MYRIWEPPDTKVPDRPPVCIITCSWYPQIRLKALACPDVSVDEFICGLQLPDAVYRILTGNRPTNIYIGNECRMLDGYGEHKSKPRRHVAVALRLVTEMGKCTLLFPNQYLNLRHDTLAELVCCETIAPTIRKIRFRIVDDRPLLDAEEQQFLATQHPNSQWLWSSSLPPFFRQPPLSEQAERTLPPWKPPQKLEWINHSIQQHQQQRRRRRQQQQQHAQLRHDPAADVSAETSKIREEVFTDELGKRERTFERNAFERIQGPKRIEDPIVDVGTVGQPLDESQTDKPSLNENSETRDPENIPHKRARIESGCNNPEAGEVIPNSDDASSDNDRSPLGKAVTELGSIIKSLTNASPGNIRSPPKQAITKLGGNLDMLKKTSNMDTGSQRDAMTQLDDDTQHLKTLSDGIDEQTAELAGGGEETTITKNLCRQPEAVTLSIKSNDMGANGMVSKNQGPAPEALPPLVSDAEPPKRQRGEITNGGRVPLLVLRQPALSEPELEKVWSDVDDDKNAAVSNDLVETNSGDNSSASSSTATSSNSSSSSSSSSSSPDSASESDSVSADYHEEGAPIEDKISSSENISNGNTSERMEFEIPEETLKDDDNHLSPENVDLDEERLSPAPRAPAVQPAEDPTTPNAPSSEATAVASNSSSKGSSSDSSSDSDSDSSSDSVSSNTSIHSALPTTGEASAAITAAISEKLSESAEVGKTETRKDHELPIQIGVNPIPTLGNRRRRKPLLSSKKKIII